MIEGSAPARAIAIRKMRRALATRARRSAPSRDREQQFGGRTFVVAAKFLRGIWLTSGTAARLRSAADARGIAASATVLLRLPRMSVALTAEPSGQAIRAHLMRRTWGIPTHRVAQSVLLVPGSVEEYLRGRKRQAVRTNIRRARKLGIRCQLVARSDRRAIAERFVDPDRPGFSMRDEPYTLPHAVCWVARDTNDRPVGFAVLSVDSEVAMLWSMVCNDHPERWLLHTQIVEMLAADGVCHLLVAAEIAPLLPPGIQFFQQLLGYRVAHLSLRDR